MTFDQTQSISVSYLLSTAFASTSDPSGKCMYYITSNLEPSTVTQIWKFWQICGANRHGTPNLIFSISAPKIDNVCGFHGSNKFLWIAASAFIFGDLQPAVTVFGNLNLKTREWTYVTGYELQQMQPFSLDFYCTPVSRPFTVDENGYMTLITKGGSNLVYAADGNLHPSHDTPSHHTPSNIPSHNSPSHHTPSHNSPSHHTPSHNTPSHHIPSHSLLYLPANFSSNLPSLLLTGTYVSGDYPIIGRWLADASFNPVSHADFTIDPVTGYVNGVDPTTFVANLAWIKTANASLAPLYYYPGTDASKLSSITVVGKYIYIAMLFPTYGLLSTIWYVPWATGGYAALFTWIPEYPGYYNLLLNQPYVSLLLVKGFQPNVFYAKFSGSSIKFDVSKITYGVNNVKVQRFPPSPSDPFSNNSTYPWLWKNATVGWRVGICNDLLVNTSQVSPGDYYLPNLKENTLRFIHPPYYITSCLPTIRSLGEYVTSLTR